MQPGWAEPPVIPDGWSAARTLHWCPLMLDAHQTVAQTVLDHSECAEVFQRHRIDFCCRGDLSIAAASEERGLNVDAVLSELDEAIAARSGARETDPRSLSTPMLVTYIVSRHHAYVRNAMPFVKALAKKVGRVHGDHNPKLLALDEAVNELEHSLLPHLDDEEQVLFPAMLSAQPVQAELSRQLEAMQGEHLEVAKILEQIRAASDDFHLPEWACNSYRTLFSELGQLERDIFAHVHLENHVLRPRFAAAA